MILKNNGITMIECEKIVKGKDYIECSNDKDEIILKASEISDFSSYEIEGGSFSEPPIDEISQLELALAELAEIVIGG